MDPSQGSAPPAAAEALLRRWVPEGQVGLSILGDLREEYEAVAEERSVPSARRWYWRNALALSARYAAHRGREALGAGPLATSGADLRFGLRMLRKTPMLSAIAILTVALGVSITTHTFSTVYGTIVRGLPVPDHERLIHIVQNRVDLGIDGIDMSVHEFEDLRDRQTAFESLDAYYQGTINVGGDEGPPERYAGAFVSATALSSLGIPPLIGRTFRPGEDAPDASPLVVLGYRVWRDRFGGDPEVLGRAIRMNGESAEIVGVMPNGFAFPFDERIWTPHRVDTEAWEWGRGPGVDVFGRLRAGVPLDAARMELRAISAVQARAHPETNEHMELVTGPFDERYMPPEIQAVLWVMLGATFGVLLIACVNVANLLLARAAVRSKEMAVRTALGASRFRVARQLMAESLVLAVVGGLVGLAMAVWGLDVLDTAVAGVQKPYWIDFRVDLPMLAFTVAVTAAAALAAGVLPALRASGVDVGSALKDEGRGSTSLRLGRFSTGLVVTEIAVSASLLVVAGFMIKSVVNLRSLDLGFETENVLTGRIGLFEADYPSAESRAEFFDLLKQRLEAEPGVLAAALGTDLPGLGTRAYYLGLEGVAYATDADYAQATTMAVTEDYFRTFGVELLEGRDFDRLDRSGDGGPVAMVSESFARRHFPDGGALGGRVRLGVSNSTRPWRTIVGVVPDMHVGGGVGGIGDDRLNPERVFLPLGSLNAFYMSFAVLTQGAPDALAASARAAVTDLDPNLPVYDLVPLARAIDDATWAFDLFSALFTIFGMAALFLAAVGLYGVIAFSVAQRRHEMGVRMALGAGRRTIMGLVLRRGGVQLAAGIAAGLLLGALVARPLRVILYGVEVGDPIVYGSILATLMVAGLAALIFPAAAASRADPIEAMRTH